MNCKDGRTFSMANYAKLSRRIEWHSAIASKSKSEHRNGCIYTVSVYGARIENHDGYVD